MLRFFLKIDFIHLQAKKCQHENRNRGSNDIDMVQTGR